VPAEMKLCTRCILPETFPGIRFDAQGVCHLCQQDQGPAAWQAERSSLKAEMEAVFEKLKGDDREFDALVAYSGGKDSTYILWLMRKVYGLRCLAITIDNGFIAERAIENARTVTGKLGVDFHLVRPSSTFVNSAFRKSLTEEIHPKVALTRASSVCNTCIGMINNHMIKTALQMNIPLIVGGYISGQVPRDAAVLDYEPRSRQKLRLRTVAQMVKHFGEDARKYYGIREEWLDRAEKIVILNPMLTLDYRESVIYETIAPLGWRAPTNTGANSSNCLLNDLGIAAHVKKYRFNPYVNELAELVRRGGMERAEALAKVESVARFDDLRSQMATLDLEEGDL